MQATFSPSVTNQIKPKANVGRKQAALAPKQDPPLTSRQTLGDLNGKQQQVAQVIRGVTAEAIGDIQAKGIARDTTNKENQPVVLHTVELSEAQKINNLISRCMPPSTKFDKCKFNICMQRLYALKLSGHLVIIHM